jgi:dGTPase
MFPISIFAPLFWLWLRTEQYTPLRPTQSKCDTQHLHVDDSRKAPETPRSDDPRPAYRRDRDRVLYSTHFARLAEITQVVSPERGYVFHNRLTHSLKVAQLARTIAELLQKNHRTRVEQAGGIEPDAAEAAGLAHDLGHPPFGHIAEEELNRLVRHAGLSDGFEGNAQSLRIVCQLAVSDAVTQDVDGTVVSVPGLNLTRSTLAGVLKYPWSHGGNPHKPHKWGHYSSEQEWFDWARTGLPPFKRTLIAEVMDWADDITYAIHDLLDFYRAGLIPLELVRKSTTGATTVERQQFLDRMFERRSDWAKLRSEYEDALDGALEFLLFDEFHRYSGEAADDQALYQFATDLITRYANAITPSERGSTSLVEIQADARRQVDVLKEFVWQYVILNPETTQLQTGQRRAIRLVFRESVRAAKRNEGYFFPEPFRTRVTECTSQPELVRIAADYVSGLTERELMRAYSRFLGTRDTTS